MSVSPSLPPHLVWKLIKCRSGIVWDQQSSTQKLTFVQLAEGVNQVHGKLSLLPRYCRWPASPKRFKRRDDNGGNNLGVEAFIDAGDGFDI